MNGLEDKYQYVDPAEDLESEQQQQQQQTQQPGAEEEGEEEEEEEGNEPKLVSVCMHACMHSCMCVNQLSCEAHCTSRAHSRTSGHTFLACDHVVYVLCIAWVLLFPSAWWWRREVAREVQILAQL